MITVVKMVCTMSVLYIYYAVDTLVCEVLHVSISLYIIIKKLCTYRILPKISPPFFSSRHDLDWGGGLFSNMHFPSNICTAGNIQSLLVFSPKERQRDDLSSRRQQTTIGGGERTCCSVCVRLQRKAKASWPAHKCLRQARSAIITEWLQNRLF